MHEINSISPHTVIDAGQNLTKVERSRKWSACSSETVHIITSMVGNDGEETMCVRQEFSQEEIDNCVPVESRAVPKVLTQCQVGEWRDEKVEQEVRGQNDRNQLCKGIKVVFTHHGTFECHLVGWIDIGGDFHAITSHPCKFQFLVRVWCVVEPFPRKGKERNNRVLQIDRDLQFSQEL
jgi:hypothetical protein